ncbi:MAG: SCP2 sterol-binding domain-containing protein [Zoogloeaceae bacterium]|jgi:predicted lipid carrier protein YhbT|nr:SCP2 sterol-binding domain-containing protein [Zoogloeaceae bacterium]
MKIPFFSALSSIPEFHLPQFVRAINQRLPQWPHAASLCLALNAAASLRILPEEALTLCSGRRVLIAVDDGGTRALITCLNGIFQPVWRETAEPDVRFHGDLHAYLKLILRQEDPDTLFFNRQLTIEGDTELGLAIKNLLDALEWPPQIFRDFFNRFSFGR